MTHVHALARRSVRRLGQSPIHSTYRPGVTERLYTNHHGGRYARYPSPFPVALQLAYARAIHELGRPVPDGEPVDARHVLFTSGSIMGIDQLVRVFCEPGEDRICITTPTFPAYATIAIGLGVDVFDVPLTGGSFDVLDVEQILAANSKLTFLCSPSNPVSTALDPAEILEVVERSRGLVVVDEAYIEYGRRSSLVRRVGQYPNLVVLRTLSKAWGLAGVRAGAILGSPEILDTVRLVQDPFGCSTPMREQVSACLASVTVARMRIDRSISERDGLAAALRELPAVEHVFASETNFLFCRLRDHARVIKVLAARPDVLAADVSSAVPDGIKISLGTPAEHLALLDVISRET